MQPESPRSSSPASSRGVNRIMLAVSTIALAVAVLTFGLVYVVYGTILSLPGAPPTTLAPPIRVTQRVDSDAWMLEVVEVPTAHSLTATTLLIRWPGNATVMSPPGQLTLGELRTERHGIQFLPVGGQSQTDLRVLDRINITSRGPYVAGLHVTIADGQTLLWQGNLIAGPSNGPQTIGVSQTSGSFNWQLQMSSVPTTHSLTTTTVLFRWASNATIVDPPGQVSLETLKTARNGVQYVPVGGPSQTEMKVLDVLTVAKGGVYVSGMQVTIADGSTILWQGTLA